MSPAMAACAALTGHLADVRTICGDVEKTSKAFVEANKKVALMSTDSKAFVQKNSPAAVSGTPAKSTKKPETSAGKTPAEGMEPFGSVTGIAAPFPMYVLLPTGFYSSHVVPMLTLI